MTLQFKGLSEDKTKLIFEDIPTIDRDATVPPRVLLMPPQNVVIMLGTWARTCQEINDLKEVPNPPLPKRQLGTLRGAHTALCKAYRHQCDTIELQNSQIHERKGVEYIDKLVSGFALYDGLCSYGLHHCDYEIPETTGVSFFRRELQISKIDEQPRATMPVNRTRPQSPAMAVPN